MSTCYVKKVGNNFYVRYANDTAWVYCPDAALSDCLSCCPHTSLTMWEDPNLVCNDTRITHPIDLLSPYYNISQEKNPPTNAFSTLCGVPPTTNLSSRIVVHVPYDPVFSGTYVFDWRSATDTWSLNTAAPQSNISISTYSDTNSSRSNKYLISLAETHETPTYKGYTEVARLDNSSSNISGAFAFPARFVFSAIQPPSDVQGYAINSPSNGLPFPATTGHRLVLGFQIPIRWRHEYSDWTVVDAGGHKISGGKYAKGWLSPQWVPSVNLPSSGYVTSFSGPNTIGLSGITNSPASYNLSDNSTAITGSCTGLAYAGFCYKTSASGLPFDNPSYGIDIGNFTGIRQYFNKYDITYNSNTYNLNETRLFINKQDVEAWIGFEYSCRTSGTICTEFQGLNPVTTGYTSIQGTCVGSYINADFVCGDNIARPSGGYFTTEGITEIKPIYSGLPDNVYPFIKTSSSNGNVYKAGSNQVIYLDYAGASDPDSFREWIDNNFNFVEIDISNNITRKWPGVDLYWSKSGVNTMLARLIPCDSAPFESNCAGTYLIEINNIKLWEATGSQATEEFLGQYGHDSQNNRFINMSDSSIQMRFIVDKWHLGKFIGNNFDSYYTLQYTTGGLPTVLDANFADDYSDYSSNPITENDITWNKIQIPVNCRTTPVGQWTALPNATGTAITIKDPIPVSYNESNTCCG